MASLRDRQGAIHPVHATHLVGRSRAMGTVIASPGVSAQHLAFNWTGSEWTLRDLASRNGTWVDGRKLAAGEVVTLQRGTVVAVGSEDETLTLVDDGPPCAWATSGDTTIDGSADLLALPSTDEPVALFQLDPERGWVLSIEEETRVVRTGVDVEVAGRTWRVSLPEAVVGTTPASPPSSPGPGIGLVFRVSSDGEYIQVTATAGGAEHPLPARAHHEILLALARSRLADAGQPAGEQGWVYTSRLMKMVRLSSNQLYVGIHRARREFEALGLRGAELVERRTTTHQVRLGIETVSIGPI